MIEKMKKIMHYKIAGHPHLTLHKAFWFGTTSGIGVIVVGGLTFALTEWAGWYYMGSVIFASVVAYVIKFVVNALWIFGK